MADRLRNEAFAKREKTVLISVIMIAHVVERAAYTHLAARD
jgi:hypothetical protein